MSDYNPYENRNVELPLSNFDAFFSLLKCIIGTGILAMPLTFKHSGIIGGPILTTICIGLLIYGISLLINCMVDVSRRTKVGYATFPDTMEYALAEGPKFTRCLSRPSRYIIDIIMGCSHYGVNVVYILFVSVNLKQFMEEVGTVIDLRIVILFVGICMLPLFLLRQLKYLVPFNIAATFLILFGLLAVFWYLFRGLDDINKREMLPTISMIPYAVGIVLFATSSVGVMLAIESKMAKPADYLGIFGILSIASIFIAALNIVFGFFGYWRFGDDTKASVTINLPSTEVLAQIIQFIIAIAVFLTYPLCGFVVINIIMNHYILKKERKHPHRIEYILRACFVIVTTLNGIAFPNLGPLVALVGAFTISLLNLIFPCCINICLHYNESYGYLYWKLIKDILIIIIGLIIFFGGSFMAIKDIIDAYIIGDKSEATTAEPDTTAAATAATEGG